MPSTALNSTAKDAHFQAVKTPFPLVVGELRETLGAKLCAYLGSVKETRAVNQWADGLRTPSDQVQRRFRVTLQVTATLASSETTEVTQVWFQGLNPLLDDRSPLRVLREDDLDVAGPLVLYAAKAFVA